MSSTIQAFATQFLNSINGGSVNDIINSFSGLLTNLTQPKQNNALILSLIDNNARQIEVLQSSLRSLILLVNSSLTVTSTTVVDSGFTPKLTGWTGTGSPFDLFFSLTFPVNGAAGQELSLGDSWYFELTWVNGFHSLKNYVLKLPAGITALGKVYTSDGSGFVDVSQLQITVELRVTTSGDSVICEFGFAQLNTEALAPEFNQASFSYRLIAANPGPLPDLSQQNTMINSSQQCALNAIVETVNTVNDAKTVPDSHFMQCVQGLVNGSVTQPTDSKQNSKSIWDYVKSFGSTILENLPAVVETIGAVLSL